MEAHWFRRLSRPLLLKDGTELVTLRDAGNFLAQHFGSVTHSAPLKFACEQLLKAAQSGARKDVAEATEQVLVLLRHRHLI